MNTSCMSTALELTLLEKAGWLFSRLVDLNWNLTLVNCLLIVNDNAQWRWSLGDWHGFLSILQMKPDLPFSSVLFITWEKILPPTPYWICLHSDLMVEGQSHLTKLLTLQHSIIQWWGTWWMPSMARRYWLDHQINCSSVTGERQRKLPCLNRD